MTTQPAPVGLADQAVSYLAPGKVELTGCQPRDPGPGEVQLEVAFTGICGTDLHIYHGAMDSRVKPPAVIGHEMSGVIAALGDGVEGLSAGERVTVMPLDWCGVCPACIAGHTHICHNLKFIGIDTPGSLQTRWNIPGRAVVGLPAGLPLKEAALAEPTAVAVHDVHRSGLHSGECALVVGGGPIGLLIAAVARSTGGDVRVMEPNPARRAIAEELGFVTVHPDGRDDGWLGAWTNGAGVDVAFEVSGVAAGLDSAVGVLATRGRLVIVAIHSTPPATDLFRVFWRELTIIGARVYERRDFDQAVSLLAAGRIPTGQLITTVLPMRQAGRAFESLERGEAMKILIDCSGASGSR